MFPGKNCGFLFGDDMGKYRLKSILLLVVALSVLFGVSMAQGPDQRQQGPPDNIAGNWTIFAENADKAGSSLKTVQIMQNGSIITGHFKGPHQSGKIQGWVNVHHVEFSTDTREVLTFRGQIQGDTMSGMYGIQGRHGQWHAQKTN
jgi:hypothetical protein